MSSLLANMKEGIHICQRRCVQIKHHDHYKTYSRVRRSVMESHEVENDHDDALQLYPKNSVIRQLTICNFQEKRNSRLEIKHVEEDVKVCSFPSSIIEA